MVINKSKDIVGDIPRIPTVYPVQDKEYAPIESLRLREEKSDNEPLLVNNDSFQKMIEITSIKKTQNTNENLNETYE